MYLKRRIINYLCGLFVYFTREIEGIERILQDQII